eukprot:m.167903 g.167903  ORF g.167903 m.167903 type:complete len:578 (+) comp10350_c0_seq9:140-1873(+)
MLLRCSGPALLGRTAVVLVTADDTIAHVKACLLHILSDNGRPDSEFRLRAGDIYLKDSLTLREYNITDEDTLDIVPIGKLPADAAASYQHLATSLETQEALAKERATFEFRERLAVRFLVFLHLLAGVAVLLLSGSQWIFGVWIGFQSLLTIYFAPRVHWSEGFVVPMDPRSRFVAVATTTLFAINVIVAIVLLVLSTQKSCDTTSEENCDSKHRLEIVTIAIMTLFCLAGLVFGVMMQSNFRKEVGYLIEKTLVEVHDVKAVLRSTKSPRLAERRRAAIELSNLVSATDDKKLAVMDKGGLAILIALALDEDPIVKDFGIEALAEMLLLPECQPAFIEDDGLDCLFSLLHDTPAAAAGACRAILQLTPKELYCIHVINHRHGLEDLIFALQRRDLDTPMLVMILQVFIDLASVPSVCAELAKEARIVQSLCLVLPDAELILKRSILKYFELVSQSNAAHVLQQFSLLPQLLSYALIIDKSLQLIISRLLLRFAEDPDGLLLLETQDAIAPSFMALVQVTNAETQANVARCCAAVLESPDGRELHGEALLDVLQLLKRSTLDSYTWELADQCLHRGM